jgi:glycosyltransferase involved in cell wall biosynthesis
MEFVRSLSVQALFKHFKRKKTLKKILCAIPQITGGGAERFLITFLQYVDRSKYDISVVLVKKGGGFDHEIPDDVSVHILTEQNVSSTILAPFGPLRYVPGLAKLLRENQPDAIISFGSLFNGAVALAADLSKYRQPVLLIEAVHESSEISRHHFFGKWLRTLFLRWTYPLASKVIAVSSDVAVDLAKNFGISQNIETIYYGIDLENIQSLAQEQINHAWFSEPRQYKVIVACGRLVEQKGFNILVEAMSNVTDDIKLILIGEGEKRAELENQIKQLQLDTRIELVGYKRNPFCYMSKADAFIMPSLWEGFGIILVEALAVGIPVISSDCPSGPRMILKDGECGILVPTGNPHALADSINKLLSTNELRASLQISAKERSEDFSAKSSVDAYFDVLSKLGKWS